MVVKQAVITVRLPRKAPVNSKVGSETDDKHAFPLLRNPKVSRIDQRWNDVIGELLPLLTTACPFYLQAEQMVVPVLITSSGNLWKFQL
ncbi:hypothetical protein WT34_24405 [Burkholderia stagnalis]|nr:hypothetical protein WT34_24405 [Burkholderia stagnalis]